MNSPANVVEAIKGSSGSGDSRFVWRAGVRRVEGCKARARRVVPVVLRWAVMRIVVSMVVRRRDFE